MSLSTAKIANIFVEEDLANAKAFVRFVLERISPTRMTMAPGDIVPVCDGVSIGKAGDEREETHVPGNSRKNP
jgi:hypothetical protein